MWHYVKKDIWSILLDNEALEKIFPMFSELYP